MLIYFPENRVLCSPNCITTSLQEEGVMFPQLHHNNYGREFL